MDCILSCLGRIAPVMSAYGLCLQVLYIQNLLTTVTFYKLYKYLFDFLFCDVKNTEKCPPCYETAKVDVLRLAVWFDRS